MEFRGQEISLVLQREGDLLDSRGGGHRDAIGRGRARDLQGGRPGRLPRGPLVHLGRQEPAQEALQVRMSRLGRGGGRRSAGGGSG
eukprot:CAMPEP_0113664574 /NCGR_PEP_ID=MMETSP0038_2-20120614/1814_1 /TAXON_ID=2898 /ORGANISM="Cryptomonas paramecium" /LENGTH=85 /DNA_ID=CAMNT_0000579809 /DNA_START=195 /DNA_END=448 /DNA_ORIENTATION=- /assembly_acc=CAM_ASM_000170